MKHLLRVILVLIYISTIVVSCVKENQCDVLSGHFDFTINATFPDLEESQTKASTGVVVRLNWKEGDKLSVINLTTGKTLGGDLVAKSTGVTTEFNGTLVGTVSSSDNLLFLYPSQSFTTEENFSDIDIDFSNQSGKSGVDVCVYAISRLGSVSVSGVSATFKFLMSYLEMNLSDLERAGTINTVKVENMGAGITISSNANSDDILTSGINGTITLSPSTKVNATGSCAVFLSTFASPAPLSARKVIVNTSNTTVAADWSAAALKAGKFYNTILTGFEDYQEPAPSEDPVPGTPIDYKVDDVILGQSIPVLGDWDNDPETENTYLHWAPVNCGYEAVGSIGINKDDHRLGKVYQWGYGDLNVANGAAVGFYLDERPSVIPTFYPSSNWNDGQGPCPHGWRMPTETEFRVLISGKNGNDGWVSSRTYGGESGYSGVEFFGGNDDMTEGTGVFFPVASNASSSSYYYWSGTFNTDTDKATYLHYRSGAAPFLSSPYSMYECNYRVRCVCDSPSTPSSAHKASLNPTVTISPNGDWSAFTADISATVLSDGGSPVTEKGVMYGTSESTITDKVAFSTGGTGSYQVTITGLTGATQYYVKAYAINSEGIACSQVFSFNSGAIGNGFNWSEVTHCAIEPLNSWSFDKRAKRWFVSDGVLYTDAGRKVLTVDCVNHTITAALNTRDYYDYRTDWSTWTGLDGTVYSCFSTNEDSEYDDYYDIDRFENGRWVSIIQGIHYRNFTPRGAGIWKTNNYLYTYGYDNSYGGLGGGFYRSSNGYSFGRITMSNVPSGYSNDRVWTSANGNAYCSYGSSHYRFYESTLSWTLLSTSNWPAITAEDVFIAGGITYWVSGGDCYMFNESSMTWTRLNNDFRAGLYGRYVWSYDGNYYYGDGTVTKELKYGGQTFTTTSILNFPQGTWDYSSNSRLNPPICNVRGNVIWNSYLKAPGTCTWNKLSTSASHIVALSLSMSGQYYDQVEEWENDGNDDYYLRSYHMYPIDPTSGIRSSDYQTFSPETIFYNAQSLWKDRNGAVHYDEDKRVFNDASGRCYYCCDSEGRTAGNNAYATHYRIYDETNGWSAIIPLNTPTTISSYLDPRNFWSDGGGNIYYTEGNTHYQLIPND